MFTQARPCDVLTSARFRVVHTNSVDKPPCVSDFLCPVMFSLRLEGTPPSRWPGSRFWEMLPTAHRPSTTPFPRVTVFEVPGVVAPGSSPRCNLSFSGMYVFWQFILHKIVRTNSVDKPPCVSDFPLPRDVLTSALGNSAFPLHSSRFSPVVSPQPRGVRTLARPSVSLTARLRDV